jgi:hypothetical protein
LHWGVSFERVDGRAGDPAQAEPPVPAMAMAMAMATLFRDASVLPMQNVFLRRRLKGQFNRGKWSWQYDEDMIGGDADRENRPADPARSA